MSKEFILCAAIHIEDGKKYEHQPRNIKTGFVVCGMRHHNCYTTIAILASKVHRKKIYKLSRQGFLTSKDRYVDRKKAFLIAKEAGQIIRPPEKGVAYVLISEDLY